MATTDTPDYGERSFEYDMRRAQGLAAIPAKHAQPDPSTLATLPKGGANLSYMGHAEVTLALIDVDPLWTWEPLAIDPTTGGPMIHHEGNRLVMWAHMGRVNSLRRMRIASDMGCDSVDGTYVVFGPDVNVPKLASWFKAMQTQPSLFSGAHT